MDPREPSVFEGLVAVTYLVTGGEHLWVARIYSILFWLLGGVALYALARRLTSPLAAIASTYLLLFPALERDLQPHLPTRPHHGHAHLVGGLYALSLGRDALLEVGDSHRFTFRSGSVRQAAGYFPHRLDAGRDCAHHPGDQEGYFQSPGLADAGFIGDPPGHLLPVRHPGQLQRVVKFHPSTAKKLAFTVILYSLDHLCRRSGGFGHCLYQFCGRLVAAQKSSYHPPGFMAGIYLVRLAFPYYITTHEYYSIPLIPAVALSLAPLAGLIFDSPQQSWITWPGWRWRGCWFFRLLTQAGWRDPSCWERIIAMKPISLAANGSGFTQRRGYDRHHPRAGLPHCLLWLAACDSLALYC